MQINKSWLWTARVMAALAVVFLAFDAIIHILVPPVVAESFVTLGYPGWVSIPLGIIELVCLALYLYRKTSVLGIILLTGYLGGAIASNLRIEAPLFSHILFPIYIALLLWIPLWIKNERVRALLPLQK